MVEPNRLQREGTDEWREGKITQDRQATKMNGRHRKTNCRSLGPDLLWRQSMALPGAGPRDDSESTDRPQGRGTERAVGKYDSFPMDAITERRYFAEQMEILAKT